MIDKTLLYNIISIYVNLVLQTENVLITAWKAN